MSDNISAFIQQAPPVSRYVSSSLSPAFCHRVACATESKLTSIQNPCWHNFLGFVRFPSCGTDTPATPCVLVAVGVEFIKARAMAAADIVLFDQPEAGMCNPKYAFWT